MALHLRFYVRSTVWTQGNTLLAKWMNEHVNSYQSPYSPLPTLHLAPFLLYYNITKSVRCRARNGFGVITVNLHKKFFFCILDLRQTSFSCTVLLFPCFRAVSTFSFSFRQRLHLVLVLPPTTTTAANLSTQVSVRHCMYRVRQTEIKPSKNKS